MPQLLSATWGNILVLAIVAATVAGALLHMRRKKKSGCGCGCDSCPSKGLCHPEK